METKDKLIFCFSAIVYCISSVIEAIGIGFIFVFLKVLLEPENFGGFQIISRVNDFFAFETHLGLILLLAAVVTLLFVARSSFLFWSTWLKASFRRRMHLKLSCRLFERFLYSDFSQFLRRKSADAMNNITMNVSAVVGDCMLGILELTGAGILLILFLSGLIIARPIYTLIAFAVLGAMVFAYWSFIHDRLHRWGAAARDANIKLYKQVGDIFSGFKFIKVSGSEPFFERAFHSCLDEFTEMNVKKVVAQEVPRLGMEAAVVVLVMAAIVLSLLVSESATTSVSTLALFGIILIRTMPAISRVLNSLQLIRGSIPSLEAFVADYMPIDNTNLKTPTSTYVETTEQPFRFRERLELKSVTYSYDDVRPALDGANVLIRPGEFVGFVGVSGSGKTTAADVLLGLLHPQEGEILIDGEQVDRNSPKYRKLFSYVPQDTFVLDDTLARNIAFAISNDQIDSDRLEHVIKDVALKGVVSRLPQGIHTKLGERGNTLSGGERQRIGIARALYTNAPILILDEPTSALDSATEAEISSEIIRLKGERTVILIAHRLNTLVSCDRIFLFNEGKVVASGDFSSLLEASDEFRAMVEHFRLEGTTDCATTA